MEKPIYPFAAIVGQEEMKLSLILCAIYPPVSYTHLTLPTNREV